MTAYEDLLYEVKDGVALVTLNRPQSLNAYTVAMGRSMQSAVEEAVADRAVRVIVLTGAGRGFCAGADMNLLQKITPGSGGVTQAQEVKRELGGVAARDGETGYGGRFGYLLEARKPLIAAINGPAAGLGLVLALYADLRFAASEARLTTSFARRGLIAEHGVSWLLPRLVGPAHALDLLLSARTLGAAEAERIGLVNRSFPQESFMQEVMAYARALAEGVSPRSTAVIKAQVWRAMRQDFNEALAHADAEMQKSFASADFREGVAHYLEKRPPNWTA